MNLTQEQGAAFIREYIKHCVLNVYKTVNPNGPSGQSRLIYSGSVFEALEGLL